MLTCARDELQAGIIFHISFVISHFSSPKAFEDELLPAFTMTNGKWSGAHSLALVLI